jgi:hypothetical protein
MPVLTEPCFGSATCPVDLAKLNFLRRQESWVVKDRGQFIKIPRLSEDPLADVWDPRCVAIATKDYENHVALNAICSRIPRPLWVWQACTAFPWLSGPDMREALLHAGSRDAAEHIAAAALEVLACIHGRSSDAKVFPWRDYGRTQFRPMIEIEASIIASAKRVVVMDGFEVRNFRFDYANSAWRFSDPHHISMGCAEQDVARFLVSLLMLNWGRDGRPWVWQRLEPGRLLDAYTRAGGVPLNRSLLNYFLGDCVAMRKFHAWKSLTGMRPFAKAAAWAFYATYFFQINRWVSANAF